MSRQPIRLTRRGELVFGALGAILALVITPAAWTVFLVVAR
ncbi:hypothetical protein [Pseudarthrobacter cellobiosi]|nr:hypothetical protein [Pseudarthrobacter sp. HLT1-5]